MKHNNNINHRYLVVRLQFIKTIHAKVMNKVIMDFYLRAEV